MSCVQSLPSSIKLQSTLRAVSIYCIVGPENGLVLDLELYSSRSIIVDHAAMPACSQEALS